LVHHCPEGDGTRYRYGFNEISSRLAM